MSRTKSSSLGRNIHKTKKHVIFIIFIILLLEQCMKDSWMCSLCHMNYEEEYVYLSLQSIHVYLLFNSVECPWVVQTLL